MIKNYFFLLAILLMSSCTAIKGIDMSNINLGMTKSEVQMKTKSFQTKTIGAKQFKTGSMEVFQISEIYRKDNAINDYWLYFFNDKLVSSEPINSVHWQAQDWDYKIDKVYFDLEK
ncbi:hypothetical protein [Kaistella jeonii]|nr:hypothetical protein [Kaistella jeonii]SFB77595.1 hypothetical protein SAMN05421876_102118 [Kaistella jeonii]VEI96390.1 Uncharacterised protein [Kaistella jeonii]